MQYALMTLKNDHRIIVDAREYFALTKQKSIIDHPVPEGDLPVKRLLYGVYMSNSLEASVDDVVAELRRHVGYGIGYLTGNTECRIFGIIDMLVYPPDQAGKLRRVPFAALAETEDDFKVPRGKCLTAFIRYADMDPAANILNRPGLCAITAEAQTTGILLERETWRRFADEKRARKLVNRIR